MNKRVKMAISLSRKIFGKRTPATTGNTHFSIALAPPVAIAMAVVLVCVVAWAFFMGFMVGRGQHPQTEIRAMTGLGEPGETAPTAEPTPTPDQPQTPETAEQPAPAVPVAHKTEAPFARPKGAEMAAWGEKNEQTPQPRPRAERPAPGKNEKPASRQIFDYSFQAAAFKSEREAENLRKTLNSKGLRAQVRKSGNVRLVVVNLRGGDSDVASLRQKLRDLKLGAPLQLSKNPVPPKNAREKTKAGQGGKPTVSKAKQSPPKNRGERR